MEPGDVKRQLLLQELIKTQKYIEKELDMQDQKIKEFQRLSAYGDLIVQIIEYFPYPIAVFLTDGLLKIVNRMLLTAANLSGSKDIVGKYNIFSNPACMETGIPKAIKRALTGETVYLFDLKFPLKSLTGQTTGGDIQGLYDAVIFPITDHNGKTSHAVAVLINQQKT